MSDTCSVQSPYEFTVGKKETLRVDFIEQLRGDLLMGTPVVQEIVGDRPTASGGTGTRLAITNVRKNAAEFVSLATSNTVGINQGVLADVEVLDGKRGPVSVRVSCDTTNASRNVMVDVMIDTRD